VEARAVLVVGLFQITLSKVILAVLPVYLKWAAHGLRESVKERISDQHMLPLFERQMVLDPPYVASTRSTHEDTYEHEMSAGDYANLAEVLRELEGMVVLSGYDCDLMQELFPSWKQVRRQAVASSQNASTTRTECLWLNDAAASKQRQKNLFD
jgi:hypothetical protein